MKLIIIEFLYNTNYINIKMKYHFQPFKLSLYLMLIATYIFIVKNKKLQT